MAAPNRKRGHGYPVYRQGAKGTEENWSGGERDRREYEQYAEDPKSLTNQVKALKGREQFRLRVGDYRVLFVIENDVVAVMVVTAVRHRSRAYD